MYILDFKCTYKKIADPDDSDNLYKLQFLQAFNLENFDDKVINKITEDLYKKFKNKEEIIELLDSIKKKYTIEDLEKVDNLSFFRFLFSYHTFSSFHNLLIIINENNNENNNENKDDEIKELVKELNILIKTKY